MDTNHPCEYKELTAEQLFGVLAGLPENPCAYHEISRRRCGRWRLAAPAELHYPDGAGASISVSPYSGQHPVNASSAGPVM
jgi:hypothetical protein